MRHLTLLPCLLSLTAALLAGAGAAHAEVDALGAFDHSLEIRLPAAVGDLQPQIALSYNSQAGDGLVGLGWQLEGFSAVSRMSFGAGINYDAGDTFVSPGGRLVNFNGSHAYHTEEESWSRYVAYNAGGSVWTGSGGCGNGPCSWKATEPDGTVLEFGGTDDSRIEAVGRGGAVRVWALSRVTDTAGNFYSVTYFEDTVNGDYRPTSVTYNQGNGRTTLYTVELTYEARADHTPEYSQSALVDLDRRLQWIVVKGAGQLVRQYRLEYDYGAITGTSRLTSVKEYGRDGVSTLPATTYRWEQGESGWTAFAEVTAWGPGSGFTDDDRYPTLNGDWNGDGKSDIGRVHNWGIHFLTSTGNGWQQYAAGPDWSPNTGFTDAGRYPFLVGDWNGDGRTDIGRVHDNGIVFHVSTGSGWQSYPGDWDGGPNRGFTDSNRYPILIGDWNGDGRTDYGRVNNAGIFFRVSSGAGWQGYPDGPTWGPNGGYTDASVYPILIGDWNGDGRTDIGRVHNTGTTFQVSTGSGWRAYADDWDGGPNRGFSNASRYPVLIGDWNGDGKTDFGRVNNAGMFMRISTGTGWQGYADGPGWGPNNGYTDSSTYPLVTGDWNGDGKTDVARVHNAGVAFSTSTGIGWRDFTGFGHWGPNEGYGAAHPILAGDWTGEGKSGLGRVHWGGITFITRAGAMPDLMTSIGNGVGSTTTVTYLPSPRVANAIRPDVDPCTSGGCGNADPSPTPLVTRLAVSDGRGNTYSKAYQYYNRRYLPGTPAQAQQLGFAWREERDEQLGIRETRHYRLDVPYQGQVARIEHYSAAVLLDRTDLAYTQVSSPHGTRLIRTSSEGHERYELGTLKYRTRTLHAHDAFGNTILTSALNDLATAADDTWLSAQFVNDVGLWRIGLPALARTCADAACGTVLDLALSYYDGLSHGQVGARAELTMSAAWRSDDATYPATTYRYDASGNVLVRTDPSGSAVESNEYDPASGALIRVSDAADNSEASTWDAVTRELIARTDASGNTTTFRYDAFGRRIRTELPHDGSGTALVEETVRFSPYERSLIRHADSGTAMTTTEHLDGLGRVWKTTQTWNNGALLQTDRHFDAAGREHKVCAAHVAGTPELAATCTTTHFDAAGRVARVESPRSGGGFVSSTTTYDGYTTRVTDVAGNVTVRSYDPTTLTDTLTQPGGLVTATRKDLLGRVLRITDPDGNVETRTYNSLGWKLTENDPVTGLTSYGYDSRGNPVAVTDAAGMVTRSYYDAASRLVRTDHAPLDPARAGPEDSVIEYDYLDAPGDVANGAGRMVRVTDRSGVSTLEHDAAGRLRATTRVMDGATFLSSSTFDRLGRRTSITYPNGAVVGYRYGSGAGHLGSVTLDGVEVMRYENYNEQGEPTSYTYGGSADTVALAFEDGTGRLLRQSDTRGFVDTYFSYDERGMLVREQDQRASRPNGDTTKAFAYDALEQLVGAAMGAGASCSGTLCSGNAWSRSYRYDGVGRVLEKDGKTFVYDAERPFQLRRVGNESADRTYDAVGRLLSRTRDGGAIDTYATGPDGFLQAQLRNGTTLHRMTTDYQGNRVKKEFLGANPQTTWDLGNYEVVREHATGRYFHTLYVTGLHGSRVAHRTVERPGLIAAAANADQARAPLALAGMPFAACIALLAAFAMRRTCTVVRARARGRAERWLPRAAWSVLPAIAAVFLIACTQQNPGDSAVQPLTGDGSYAIQSIARGDTRQPVPGTFYYLNSPLGSTSVMFDGQGTSLLRLEYFPDGTLNVAASVGDYIARHSYGQKEYDAELDAYYNAHRYYDAQTLRFTSPDSIKDSDDFLVHNTYAYARNNPVNFTDPTGYRAMKPDGVGGRKVVTPPVVQRAAPAIARVTRLGSMQVDSAGGARAAPRARPTPVSRPAHRQTAPKLAQAPDNGPPEVRARPVPATQSMMIDGENGPVRALATSGYAATVVYYALDPTGTSVTYVGITNNFERRAREHMHDKARKIWPLMTGLSRYDARSVEQALIVLYGRRVPEGGTLDNIYNSLDPRRADYNERVERGMELLRPKLAGLPEPARAGPSPAEEQLAQQVIDNAIRKQEEGLRRTAGSRFRGGGGLGGGIVGMSGGGMRLRM